MTTFDFEDGKGPVSAHRHMNPDGTEGGWVADTASVADTCYIGYNARVSGNAYVTDNAHVTDNARVSGNARVFDNTWVSNYARVSGNARVSDNARIYGNAWVFDYAWVFDNARIYGYAEVSGDAWVNKSLNHKSIIDAFEDVYKEFSQMSETEFKEMINESNLPTLGETNKPKETKKKLYCINCKYIKCYDPYELSCGHPTNMVETSGVYRCCVEPIETIKTLNKNNECKLYKKKWYKFWVK